MVYSVNQARQFYVANALKSEHVLATDDAGSIAVRSDKDKKYFYFEYRGAVDSMRSDLVGTDKVLSVSVTKAASMAHALKSVKVTLDSEVNGGVPVSGQDYILRISFRQFLGMSDEDYYFKHGAVHAYAGMSASDFYKKLAISLVKNFSRELVPLVTFDLVTDTGLVSVDNSTKEADLTGTYTGIQINEAEQEWVLGTKEQVPVYFDVNPTTIVVDGDEVIWGTVESATSKDTINNGKKAADLEYFFMGERGDIYRNISWPNVIPTKYLVDPSKPYNFIDIHYYSIGDNHDVQKSEKTLTVAIPADTNTLTNNIIKAINTASGLSVATL